MGLAMSAANPDVVYALVESEDYALYRSNDGGVSFQRQSTDSDVGNRPFYYAEIHCDPTNEDHVYSLWSMVSKSTDGGRTFDIILPYSGVHPDHHAMYIHPTDPNYLINGNDGGLNISRDGGEHWTFVNNLPVGQFYHIAVDDEEPYNVYGGMQDNGSWVGPSAVWHADGIRNEDWQEVLFGDGFDVQPTGDGDVYAMYQGGALNRVSLNYASFHGHSSGVARFGAPSVCMERRTRPRPQRPRRPVLRVSAGPPQSRSRTDVDRAQPGPDNQRS